MYRLFTLGAVTLLPPTGNGASALLSSRKPLALLAYLASAHRRFSTRDSLIGLFWPESDHSHARSSLNQSLHLIRQAMGSEALEVRGGEEVRLAPEAVWCDVSAFRRCLARDRHDEALRLYRGDLLSGFFVRGAEGFERWLELERAALRREAAGAAWRLAGRSPPGAAADGSTAMLRRAIELAGWDDDVAVRAMRLAVEQGNPSLAQQIYREYESWLARELEMEPGPQPKRMAVELQNGRREGATVRRAWSSSGNHVPGAPTVYSRSEAVLRVPQTCSAAVARPDAPAGVAPSNSADGDGAADPKRREQGSQDVVPSRSWRGGRWRVRLAVGAGPVGLLLALAMLRAGHQATDPESRALTPPAEVVVGEFIDPASPAAGSPVATQLGLALTAELTRGGGVKVLAREYAGRRVSEAGSRSRFSVDGSASLLGDSLRATALLASTSGGSVLGVFSIAVPNQPDAHTAILALARELATALRHRIGDEAELSERRAADYGQVELAVLEQVDTLRQMAFRLHAEGSPADLATLQFADSLLRALDDQGVNGVPRLYARAQLWETYAWLELIPPRSDTAGAQRAMIRGIAHVSQALAREPKNPAALELRGSLRRLLAAATPAAAEASSHLVAAEADLQAAVDADPRRGSAWSLLSALLLARGAFVEAHWAARRAFEADTHLRNPQEILGRLYRTAHEIGDDQEAEEWCQQMEVRFPRTWPAIDCRLSQYAWSTSRRAGSVSVATIAGLLDEVADPPPIARAIAPRLELLAGTAMARHGHAAHARAIAERLAPAARHDPELLYRLASLRLALGQRDQAIQALRDVVRLRPQLAGMLQARRFAELRSDPRLMALGRAD